MSGEDGAATSAVLFSVHKHLQKRCADRSAAYLACKKKEQALATKENADLQEAIAAYKKAIA